MKTRRQTVALLSGIIIAVALSMMPVATLWADSPKAAAPPPPLRAELQAAYGQLPLSFEANQGQVDPHVQFLTRGHGHTLFLTPSDAVLALRTDEAKGAGREGEAHQGKPSNNPPPTSRSAVRMTFEGANPQAEMVGLEKLPGIVNYFIGADPSNWRTNIPTYQKVAYTNVYPGIDLVYYGNQGQLEYDLIVAPGADPTQITLAFDGVEQMAVDVHGDLVLTVPQSSNDATGGDAATLRLHKPVVYQRDEQGEKHLLAGTYVLLASEPSRSASAALHRSETSDPSSLTPHVAFQVAAYDASQPLIIDPVLSWATYLGGSGTDIPQSIAVDQAGQAYVTGYTNSSGFPGITASSIQSTHGGSTWDVFVTKLNAAGTTLLYSTYLGGSGDDLGYGIAVDQAGQAYVTGFTVSPSDFPGITGSSIQSTNAGGASDAFVTKLNAAGTTLLYSTYLGGTGEDGGSGIAVDTFGNTYVTGYTNSSGFPGTSGSSIQSTYGGGTYDAFVTKLNAAGTALVYATYLGGSGIDVGRGIAVDQAGQAYVTGVIRSTSGFPGITGSSIQSTHAGGVEDAFVTKLNAAGTQLLYSTYLGGSGDDYGSGIAVDQAGNAYVTGFTYSSSDFPGITGSSIQSTHGGGGVEDVFVTKLNAAGTALVYSTYLGGTGKDDGIRIAMDWVGNAYVTGGTTTSSGFPGITASSIQSTNGGGWDGFVAKIQFVMPVSIDIKPGSFPNSINLGSNGVVPVAILGSATFDASQVDPLTVTMADAKVKLKGKGTPMASLQDVNGDGFLDLVVQVSTSTLVLNANDTEAIVEGATVGGTTFRGKDSLRTVP